MITFGKGGPKKGGFQFSKQEPAEKANSLDALEGAEREKAEAYRAHQKAEQQRYINATDSEFWIAVCFRDPADLEAFASDFGFGAMHARIRGEDAENALAPFKPEGRKIGFGGTRRTSSTLLGAKTPDPLATVEYTGSLEADCFAEFAALHAALTSAQQPEQLRDVTDSETWFVIIFANREHKTRFLEDFNLTDLGDKYVDGNKMHTHLRR